MSKKSDRPYQPSSLRQVNISTDTISDKTPPCIAAALILYGSKCLRAKAAQHSPSRAIIHPKARGPLAPCMLHHPGAFRLLAVRSIAYSYFNWSQLILC